MLTFLSVFSLVLSAQADHRARFETESNRARIPDMKGEILMRENGDVRINADKPLSISVLMKKGEKKATLLVHFMKVMSDADGKKYVNQVPACVGKAIESCLVQSGFKKSKTEKNSAGMMETLYEKSSKTGKAKLWVPENSQQPFPSKMVFESKDGLLVTTRFTDPKEVQLDAKLFTVPPGYSKSSGLGSILQSGESMLAPKNPND